MSNKEYFSILSISILSTEYIFLPWIIVNLGGVLGIYSLILLTIIRILLWIIVSRILMKYPNCSILEIIDFKYGKYIGFIVKVIYCLYLVLVQILMLMTTYLILSSYTLKSTPKFLVIGLILVAIFYCIEKGIGAIFKISKLGISLLVLFILTMLLLVNKIEYTNFFPMKDNTFYSLVYTTFIITCFFSGLECPLIYSKFVKDTKAIRKVGIFSILFSQFIFIAFTLLSYGVLGKEMIVKQKWSLYAMLSLLDTRFISNPEIVLCFISVIIILMTLSIYTYSTSYCLNSMFSKENNNNIITNIFIIVLLFISTIYVSSKYSIYELLYFKQVYPIIAIILIFMCLIKKEKRKDRGEN